MDMWEDNRYDLAVFDEFQGQKTISWMNEFAQGSVVMLKKKGSQYLKAQNIPLLVVSNHPLVEVYHNVASDKVATLECRFTQVHITQFINVFGEKLGEPCTKSSSFNKEFL